MKAIVQSKYGEPDDVLDLQEIDPPVIRDDEVLVRVHAASVNPDVWHSVTGFPYMLRIMGSGLLRPRNPVPGIDMAGHVEAVGESVAELQPGDEVFGETVKGHQWKNGGAYAEYVSVPRDKLALKPARLSFEEAAAVPTSALIALDNLRGRVEPGQQVLVNGAGGGVGIFAVQLAKSYGAEVTAVDRTGKLEMLRSIGADRVIDYTQEDFTQDGKRYDLIFDIPGTRSLSDIRHGLTPNGMYVLIGHDRFGASGSRWIGSLGRFFRALVMSPFVSQRMAPRIIPETKDRMAVVKELCDAGELSPVIDRTYPLGEVLAALRRLQEGEARGKIVITV